MPADVWIRLLPSALELVEKLLEQNNNDVEVVQAQLKNYGEELAQKQKERDLRMAVKFGESQG